MSSNQYNIVCFPGTLFDKEPYTNRQRVMINLEKRGHQVIYVEPPKNPVIQLAKALLGVKKEQKTWKWFKRLLKTEKRKNKFFILSNFKFLSTKGKKSRVVTHFLNSLILKRQLKKMGIDNPILWIYTPDAVDYTRWIKSKFIVYDCVDEYAEQPWYQSSFKDIQKDEDELLNKADIVFTSSEPLYNSKKRFNPNTYLMENVADFDHFYRVWTEQVEIHQEIKSLSHPVIGFIGAIDAYKLDLEAVKQLALDHPNWSIVLIGPVGEADKTPNLEDVRKLGNIYLLGSRRYDQLPEYIRGFDACVIPYKENKYTVGCFPLKFFEFLASGKPVVTKGLPSLKKFSDYGVWTNTYEDFSMRLEQLLENDPSENKEERISLAKQYTWDSKVDKMTKILDLTSQELPQRRTQ